MNSEERRLEEIAILRNVNWLQKNRFSVPINELFAECKTEQHLWIISKLLKEFKYIDSGMYLEVIDFLASVITEIWGLDSNQTIITAICDSTKIDGSQVIATHLRNSLPTAFGKCVFNSIDKAFQTTKKNIVLVDDFIGSGEKIRLRLLRLLKHLNEKGLEPDIYILSFAGMTYGINVLKNVGVKDIFTAYEMSKAISENIRNPDERSKAIDAMIELEQGLLRVTPHPRDLKFNEYNFGFGQSETIFYSELLRIPNNVFPIFWKENGLTNEQQIKKRNPIFRR